MMNCTRSEPDTILENIYPGRICDALALHFNRAAATGIYDQHDKVWAKAGVGSSSDVHLRLRFEVKNSSQSVPVDSLRRDCGLCSGQDLDFCSNKTLGNDEDIPVGKVPKTLDNKILCGANVVGYVTGELSGARSLGFFGVLVRLTIIFILINGVSAQEPQINFTSRSIIPWGRDGWNQLVGAVDDALNAQGYYGTGRREFNTQETTSCGWKFPSNI